SILYVHFFHKKRVFQQPAIRALMLKILFGEKGQSVYNLQGRGVFISHKGGNVVHSIPELRLKKSGTSFNWGYEETHSISQEFTTSRMLQHMDSHSVGIESDTTMDVGAEVTFPPYTQAILRQGPSSITMEIDYDYPVVISYKVKVVALGSQRSGGITTSFMRPVATFGIDRDRPRNEASPLEIDAAENFRILWGFRNDPGRSSLHSTNPISLNRIWSEMKQAAGSGNISNFDLLFGEDGLGSTSDAILETRFIRSVTVGMTEAKPMTVVRSRISYQAKSTNVEIFDFQPLYRLDVIKAPGLDYIDLLNGSRYFVDVIVLTGENKERAPFYGFHSDKGGWALTDAEGNLHDGSIARLIPEIGTGRPIVVANDNNTVGTVFLRYLIRDDVYFPADLNRYMTPDDLGMRTAIIPVNVISAGALGIASQPQGGTVIIGEAATFPLSVEVVAAGNITYQWYVNTEPSTVGGLPIDGATDPTFDAPSGTIGIFYYYVVVSIDEPEVEPVRSMFAMLSVEEFTGVQEIERVVPDSIMEDVAIIVPVASLTAEFTAGPNPVAGMTVSSIFSVKANVLRALC
ncbi:MAG: hypothetical protein LBU83_00455, partial [Bacteroidales bacterium]|nr:hypothetical protein [Bacteroidales bacterium]